MTHLFYWHCMKRNQSPHRDYHRTWRDQSDDDKSTGMRSPEVRWAFPRYFLSSVNIEILWLFFNMEVGVRQKTTFILSLAHVWQCPLFTLVLPRWRSWWRLCLPVQETRDLGLIPGWGGSPGGGHGNLLLYFCLENPTERGVWKTTVHGVIWAGHNWVHMCTHTLSLDHTWQDAPCASWYYTTKLRAWPSRLCWTHESFWLLI